MSCVTSSLKHDLNYGPETMFFPDSCAYTRVNHMLAQGLSPLATGPEYDTSTRKTPQL